jgi:hypothetical protein
MNDQIGTSRRLGATPSLGLCLLLASVAFGAPLEMRIQGEEMVLPSPAQMSQMPADHPFVVTFNQAMAETFAELPARDRPSENSSKITVAYESKANGQTRYAFLKPSPLPEVYANSFFDKSDFAKSDLSDLIPDDRSDRHRLFWRHVNQGRQVEGIVLCRGKILLLRLLRVNEAGDAIQPTAEDIELFKQWVASVEEANSTYGSQQFHRIISTIAVLIGGLIGIVYWVNREKLKAKGIENVPIPPGIL